MVFLEQRAIAVSVDYMYNNENQAGQKSGLIKIEWE